MKTSSWRWGAARQKRHNEVIAAVNAAADRVIRAITFQGAKEMAAIDDLQAEVNDISTEMTTVADQMLAHPAVNNDAQLQAMVQQLKSAGQRLQSAASPSSSTTAGATGPTGPAQTGQTGPSQT